MFVLTREQRVQYMMYFIASAFLENGFPTGVTRVRLKRALSQGLLEHRPLWDDMARHGTAGVSPEELRSRDLENFKHCEGNFWGIVVEFMTYNWIM